MASFMTDQWDLEYLFLKINQRAPFSVHRYALRDTKNEENLCHVHLERSEGNGLICV